MKEFLLILFFANTILLTPAPINIFGEVEIQLENPIEAITSGASIQIDITDLSGLGKHLGIVEKRKWIALNFPENSIEAKLVTSNSEEVILVYKGASLINNRQVLLSLYAVVEMPTGVKFSKLAISSKINISGVKVYWRNFTK